MTAHTVLWIYIALMFLGGLMGFVKAKSRASLIASSIFAAILALFALDMLPFRFHFLVLLFLVVFFVARFARSKKMMPNGMMAILTLAALVAGYFLRY